MNGQMNNNIESQATNNNLYKTIMNVPNSLPTEPSIKPNDIPILNNNQSINAIGQTKSEETPILNNSLVSPIQTTQNNLSNQVNIVTNNIGNNNIQTNTTDNNNYNLNQTIPNLENQNNKFLTNNTSPNETTLNNLNINGEYNNMNSSGYMNEPIIQENLGKQKKNTITITPELKIVIIIALVLLVFIFIMPYIFDAIRGISY